MLSRALRVAKITFSKDIRDDASNTKLPALLNLLFLRPTRIGAGGGGREGRGGFIFNTQLIRRCTVFFGRARLAVYFPTTAGMLPLLQQSSLSKDNVTAVW